MLQIGSGGLASDVLRRRIDEGLDITCLPHRAFFLLSFEEVWICVEMNYECLDFCAIIKGGFCVSKLQYFGEICK